MALASTEIVRRLAFIRYMHSLGIEQTGLPEPMSSVAVLVFHDAVESFLLMAGEHLGAPSIYEFEKYWDALKPAKLPGGVELPVQQGMKRLNKHRLALKHHGGHPNVDTIELIKSDTTTFLTIASQLVFDVDYQAVSMANVIPQQTVRDLVLKADTATASDDRVEAMIALVDAWEALFNPWPRTKAVEDSSPLQFGPSIGRTLEAYEIAEYLHSEEGARRRPRTNEDLGRQITAVTDVVKALQQAARLTAVGIDYAAYLRFRALTPYRVDYINDRHEYRAPANYAPAEEHVTFCTQFIVSAAIRLAAVEAQLTEPPWIDIAHARRRPWKTIKETHG